MPNRIVKPVMSPLVRTLCYRPYPGHRKGCPNYGKRGNCPPKALLLGDFIDFSKPIVVVWNAFDLNAHALRMVEKHPEWTDRQVYCCLYWQGTARSALRDEIEEALMEHGERLCVVARPEGPGVNVTATMKKIGIELEWPPRKVAYQVALLGTVLKGVNPVMRDGVMEF